MTAKTKKTWRTVRLGDVATLHRGYDLPIEQMRKGNHPVIFSNGKIERHNEYKIEGPGVITGRSGTLGNIFYLSENFWPHNTTLYVSDFHGNDPHFIYYMFKRLDLAHLNAGSGVPTLNRNHAHEIAVQVPEDTDLQKRIAGMLSAFDEKIENNNRIIKTLEEMAQAIFKKRFDTSVENLPEGWEMKNVLEMVKRIPVGKKYENKTALSAGKVPILDQGQSGYIGFHNDEPGIAASIDEPVVVFTNHTCNYRLMTRPFSAIQNVLPYIGTNGYPTLFVYYLTKDKIKMQEYKGHWPEFEQQQFVAPLPSLAEEFASFVKPMVQKIVEAENENQKLAAMRDLLLPRLMSGEIRV
ncbi:MAG: hypothetical protein A3J31_00055 [Candidatus Taylorbacteria bacterium RIFCSPLOWO2_02_FULL_48_16]|nr:MAG: hypothetical protein A3J31_00055 [Candidatus Taylorbacteria bacterium RIFCSPLOWO2_02_FULL_48_16]